VELLALRDLVVQFVLQPEVLTSDGVRSWLQRQSARSMKLTLVRDSLEVTGVSSEEQDRLVELPFARNATRR
jgi:hypothetical protein